MKAAPVKGPRESYGVDGPERKRSISPPGTERIFRTWMFAWFGGSVLGMVNGTARELLYKESVGEEAAHYISTATLLVLLALYVAFLQRRWPILNRRDAWKIGACFSG